MLDANYDVRSGHSQFRKRDGMARFSAGEEKRCIETAAYIRMMCWRGAQTSSRVEF